MSAEKKCKQWLPLEANPEVMAQYVEKLGGPQGAYFVDVMSTEDWALDMIPRPVHAVLMLYPIKDASEQHRKEEAERIGREGQVVSPNVWFTKQTIGNACGTVGILHALLNLRGTLPPARDGFFERFFEKTRGMTPAERADALEADDEVETAHTAAEHQGQSAQPEDPDVDTHFIALVPVDGHVYEMDGRKSSPINHGATSPDTFLLDAVRVVKEFMARDPTELRFNMIAITGSPPMDD